MQLVAKEHGCLGSSGGNTTGRFENPFVTIPSAYQTLDSFMRVNGAGSHRKWSDSML